jgi:hypothetical protein
VPGIKERIRKVEVTVQLTEIEDSLSNGFHDAYLESIHVDYKSRRGLIKLRVCTGDPDAPSEKEREAYEEVSLELLGLLYFVIEPPDPRAKYAETGELSIDGGPFKPGVDPPMPVPVEQLPSDAFAYWFFVRDWNSFIHVSARDARLNRSLRSVVP